MVYRIKNRFLLGCFLGLVEPIAAVITILISSIISVILPYLLTFAAGAMFYVIICELIPDTQEGDYSKLATVGIIIRFFNYDDFRCYFWINN